MFTLLSAKTRTRWGYHHLTLRGTHPLVLILLVLPVVFLPHWISQWARLPPSTLLVGGAALVLFLRFILPPIHERIHWAAYRLVGIPAAHLVVYWNYIQAHGRLTFRQWGLATAAPLVLAATALVLSWLTPLPPLQALFQFYVWLGLADSSGDLSWLVATARIGAQGAYWDRGRSLHVVWPASVWRRP